MSYRYVDANSLVGIVDAETQEKINQMPCIYADIKPNNQHINFDEIRADERRKFANWCDRNVVDFLDQDSAEEVIEMYEKEQIKEEK